MSNSRIEDIDTGAGYNDRGTFSNEPLDFVQDLAKDLFRFSPRLELFYPFLYKKKSLAVLKTAVLSSVIRQQYKNWIDEGVHECYSDWESLYNF